MAFECTEDREIRFPSDILCLKWGYTESLPKVTFGFGNKKIIDQTEITAETINLNRENFRLFCIWYIQETNYGFLPFLLNLDLYGLEKDWLVRFDNTSEITNKISSGVSEMTLKFKVVDDIEEAITSSFCNKF